jgi:hypothetical protein
MTPWSGPRPQAAGLPITQDSNRIDMRLRTSLLLLTGLGIIAGVLIPSASQAQTIPSPYRFIDTRHELTFQAGAVSADRGVRRLGPGGGPIVGARYAFEITGPAAVEISATFMSTDREVYDPTDDTSPPELIGTADLNLGLVEGRFRLNLTGARTWNYLAPYLYGGMGLVVGSSARLAAEEELPPGSQFTFGPSATFSLGTGTRFIPRDPLSFRVEAGFNLWKVGNPPAFRFIDDEIGEVGSGAWPSWTSLSMGISYRF